MEHEFKPKEWVLTRDYDNGYWTLNIFSHKDGKHFHCVFSQWLQCIPYEGNEHLLGTDKPADAPMELGGWKVGDKVEVEYDTDKKWYGGEIVRIDLSNRSWVDREPMPYYVRSECFKYNDGCAFCAARQLRKPEKKSESANEWRPKEGEAVEVLVNDEWQTATLILDDHTDCAPYLVNRQNGDKTWCTEEQVRPARKKPEEEEFKFGDRVKARIKGEWREAIVLKNDGTRVPYYVATTNGATWWCKAEDVRRA